MKTVRGRWLVFGLFLAGLLGTLISIDAYRPSGRNIVRIGGIDPTCYFGIAHSLLFDRDVDLTNELRVFPPAPSQWTAIVPATGRPGSPYAIGYSLLALPFLAAGTAVDALIGHAADGYSRYALLFYFFANLAFSLAGLFLVMELMIDVFDYSRRGPGFAICFLLLALFLGTSLVVYSFSPMSHAATFLSASALLVVWYRGRDSYLLRVWAAIGFLAGVLAITRWQDGLFLGGVILYDAFNWRDHINSLQLWLRSRSLMTFAFCFCWIPQLLEWKAIYGRYLTVPQGNGFLQWPPSFFFHVLFSTSHGWFVWTPIIGVGFGGLIYAACKRPKLMLPWLIVALAEIAVMGSMPTNWDGSDSFSIRSLTSCLPVISLGLGGLLIWPTKWMRVSAYALVALGTCYALVFAAQYRLDLIPRQEGLTAQELWGDKLHFRRALARHSAHQEAQQLLLADRPTQAVKTVQQAIALDHEDRFLLADLEQALRTSGDVTAAESAHDRLQNLLDHRLF